MVSEIVTPTPKTSSPGEDVMHQGRLWLEMSESDDDDFYNMWA